MFIVIVSFFLCFLVSFLFLVFFFFIIHTSMCTSTSIVMTDACPDRDVSNRKKSIKHSISDSIKTLCIVPYYFSSTLYITVSLHTPSQTSAHIIILSSTFRSLTDILARRRESVSLFMDRRLECIDGGGKRGRLVVGRWIERTDWEYCHMSDHKMEVMAVVGRSEWVKVVTGATGVNW